MLSNSILKFAIHNRLALATTAVFVLFSANCLCGQTELPSLQPQIRMAQMQVEELPQPSIGRSALPVTPRLDVVPTFSVRIKDITTIEGHRSNRIEGFGLVTGLKGTGGKGAITQQFATTLLQNHGILANQVPTKSLSVVSVSAEVPAFYRPGETLIATVSVLDDATSLFGGQLLRTPLMGIDGQIYALAGGALEIGGFSVGGEAATLRKNHDTVGKVNAQMEVEICNGPPFNGTNVRLLLRNKDYTTAYRIATEINKFFPRAAQSNDAGSVDVIIPRSFADSPMDFVVMINNLRVEPDSRARVVINEKTGTIVVGKNVRLSSVLFAKDNLIIATTEAPVASQPSPFGGGDTAVLPRTSIEAIEQGGRYNIIPANTTVGELANALNALGVSPQDIISVFLAIQAEGSLHAELVIE
ncbi:MAG TPA: flagellar basal body P-ring protein FlgI [Pirellulaceae bacterium]|nr:flagellar basal body P-ring protein FlgI [Pirellulaceae bacterium]HMO90911.1 flagellar basal body P-ring protein FlgI [Pirellulaceae bacterium]HMP68613.1 flagellar basal body P-ring protein FlgI [Pirellulaceae bacterium]